MDASCRGLGTFFFIAQAIVTGAVANEIPVDVKLGYTARLPCLLSMEPTQTVTWFRKNEMLTFGMTVLTGTRRMEVQKSSALEWDLGINNVRREDKALYICKTGTRVVSRVRLRIMSVPKIVNDGSTQTTVVVTEFSDVTLTCDTVGYPKPNVTWYRESQGNTTTDLGVTGKTLTFFNVTRYGADTYICKASNSIGVVSRYMKVAVSFDPEVIVYQTEVYAVTEEDVLMTCEIQGQPLSSFFWKTNLNHKVDKSTWKYEYDVQDITGYPVRFITLKIKSKRWDYKDYGNYTCIATGPDNSASGTVELKNP